MGLSVRVVDDVAGFAALQPAWDSLVERSRTATIFSTFEWNWTAWDYRRAVSRPFILEILDGDVLVGLVPLRSLSDRAQTTLVPIAMGYRSLADYVDVVVADGYEESVLEHALGFLASRPGWQLLEWPELNESSPSFADVRRAAAGAGLHVVVSPGAACRRVELPASWSEYLARLSANMRRVERRERKLRREHEVCFDRVTEEPALEPALAAAQAMQERRWAGGVRSQEHVAYMGFLRRLSPLLMRRGWLDAQVLRVDGAAVAVLLAFSFRDTVHGCLTAFESDPLLQSYGLGTLVIAHAFRSSIEAGKRVFDLARGDDAYKARWASVRSRNYRVRIVRSRARFVYYRCLELVRRLRERLRPTHRPGPTRVDRDRLESDAARGAGEAA